MFENLTPETMSMLAVGLLVAWFTLQLFKLIFELVRDYLNKKSEDGDGDDSCSELIECLDRLNQSLSCVDQKAQVLVDWVGDLHEWHNVTDPRTGTRVWYSSFQNSALQETLVRVGQTLEKISDILRDLSEGQREHQGALSRAQESLNELKKDRDA